MEDFIDHPWSCAGAVIHQCDDWDIEIIRCGIKNLEL